MVVRALANVRSDALENHGDCAWKYVHAWWGIPQTPYDGADVTRSVELMICSPISGRITLLPQAGLYRYVMFWESAGQLGAADGDGEADADGLGLGVIEAVGELERLLVGVLVGVRELLGVADMVRVVLGVAVRVRELLGVADVVRVVLGVGVMLRELLGVAEVVRVVLGVADILRVVLGVADSVRELLGVAVMVRVLLVEALGVLELLGAGGHTLHNMPPTQLDTNVAQG